MKSEKAKEYITHATCTAQEYAERFGGRELVVSRWDVSTAIELADLKYRLSSLTQWRDIQADPKWGFATDDAIDEIFRNLPRLVRDKRDGSIELIDYDNAAEWRGDLERKPSLYQWLPINGNTL